ncbi:MAG: acid phosphatase, partial [Proteobacteria bacterium]|nr:acid phosphatase [Pseudomonadota bacterium]
LALAALTLALNGCGGGGGATAQGGSPVLPSAPAPSRYAGKVDHIVVIYMENRSFDSLYGSFPGANGLANATTFKQVDLAGVPYATLPSGNSGIPAGMPVAPFDLSIVAPVDSESDLDVTHQFYQEQAEINGGKMDRFVTYGSVTTSVPRKPLADGVVFGTYDGRTLPLGRLAARYTLCDAFFHSAFGGSFLNHQWLIAARTPVFQPLSTDPPTDAANVAVLDGNGLLIDNFGASVTPDGYVVNTSASVQLPQRGVRQSRLVTPQLYDTIGTRLDDAGISWAWYSEDWDAQLAGQNPTGFQVHHQPFAFFKRYDPKSAPGQQHLRDLNRLTEDLDAGRPLRSVSFVKFDEPHNEHPGGSIPAESEQRAVDLVNRIQQSADGPSTLIVITYDENGGF